MKVSSNSKSSPKMQMVRIMVPFCPGHVDLDKRTRTPEKVPRVQHSIAVGPKGQDVGE